MRESTRVWILQSAIDYVKYGIEPSDPFDNEEEEKTFQADVKDLQEYLNQVGPEEFSKTEFDIPYSYDDENDE